MSHLVATEAGNQHGGDGDSEEVTAAQARGHGNLIKSAGFSNALPPVSVLNLLAVL